MIGFDQFTHNVISITWPILLMGLTLVGRLYGVTYNFLKKNKKNTALYLFHSIIV